MNKLRMQTYMLYLAYNQLKIAIIIRMRETETEVEQCVQRDLPIVTTLIESTLILNFHRNKKNFQKNINAKLH